jgi:hypothetical protein
LVYHIEKLVNVPAKGSIEAVAVADQTGEKYNIGMKDFTLPGFKGTSKYNTIYARSKTAMTGGFVGIMPKVADADLAAATVALEQALKEEAIAAIHAQKPAGSLFFKNGGLRTTFTSSLAPSSEGKAILTGKLIAEGLLFEKAPIEKMVADTQNGEQKRYDNIEDLNLSIEDQRVVTSFISGPVLSFKLSGTLTTGNLFNADDLRNALAGKSKNQLQEILGLYPEISHAEATVRPFWSETFPENPDRIKVTITEGE